MDIFTELQRAKDIGPITDRVDEAMRGIIERLDSGRAFTAEDVRDIAHSVRELCSAIKGVAFRSIL